MDRKAAISNIPDYPQFTALDFEHKAFFDQAFKRYPPQVSEFTFTNLFSWRASYGYKVSLLGGTLILRLDISEPARFLQPIGGADPAETMGWVLRDTKGAFIRIPEEVAGVFEEKGHFKVAEDRDNWDYLYSFSDLTGLPGRKYDGKRNLIRKFKSEYDYLYLDIRANEATSILEFEEAWCAIKDCDNVEGLNKEREVIRQIIAHFADFNLKAGVIKVKEKVRAVAIAEALNPQTLVMHILKADPTLPGLYQVMLNDFLRSNAGDFKYVNLEQDLGIAGLRSSKESYHPLKLIKKYTVSL
ncbi:MAG TPA: phosphatidylglycerol lysyltransferase domain-containing protein [Candidatus Margulisiibacteriota bacterium]|nr:phosphatidylglycerol lysyltransferase domain-containing protein [Candidatus Margulisiibacteriota bacterium]